MTRIHQLGTLADTRLRSLGLILTQGGEPTFVPTHASTPEWTTAALGTEKLLYARRLARRLVQEVLPGAAIILTSGKLYPGESQPRWRLSLGQAPLLGPLWNDYSLLQFEPPPPSAPTPSIQDGFRVIQALARRLGLNASPIPAYEDVTEWMRLEENRGATCPLPRFCRQKNSFIVQPAWTQQDQTRWQPYCQPAGFVLPLLWTDNHWSSPHWELPGDQDLVLLTGESPLGLRLPLHRIAVSGVKCALTTEIKNRELRLFLPPLPSLDAFAQLLACLETTLTRDSFPPIVLEGYLPPPCPAHQFKCLNLTADPGVIEVNLPPCAAFDELAQLGASLYQAAHACGLRGFKFQPNGRRVGTGGGSHLLLGGPSLKKNPFVLRPRLLPSFIRFVHNHPSLSYLFTGLFIGPSCQATRVDETTAGAVPELELALRSIESLPSPADADLIDRILRNLLQDWHGNPHRTEICIDKFSYPFNPDGRLGLVEFRAVEMMPTLEMFLAVHALFRALAAVFAEHPYSEPLQHWGNALHDQFFLPHFLQTNFQHVLDFLSHHGFHFSWAQFQPHLDFRCPRIADWELDGVQWEIRQALEPWPVMGAQPGPGGSTSRPVDVSTDRLQITQLSPALSTTAPYLVVNGLRIPFQPLPHTSQLRICGLRYRRFNNTLGLQPQITAHTPLTFDLVHPDSHLVLQSFHYLECDPSPNATASLPADEDTAHLQRLHSIVPLPDRQGIPSSSSTAQPLPHTPFTLDLRAVSR